MIKIICNENDWHLIDQCINYDNCTDSAYEIENYCQEKCIYNTNQINFSFHNKNTIEVFSDFDFELKVCIHKSLYNSPKCGVESNCEFCRFFYKNIVIHK